ncbi:hypothetical protein M569_16603 [Genlisea aurea]|uniref:Uncharacterized protein n=1 Tax=Genlisea aurea TaxID=192259 RepID=S8DFQ5_9LAMI|nr:hypothetical protein M569_16603 [Genlisea aurea]
MGNWFSRSEEDGDESSGRPPTAGPSAADLLKYEAACLADPQLRSFDSALQERTSRAINSIAVGLDVRSLSLESLTQVTESLMEMNQEVVKLILQSKKDIWKNKNLSDLVDDYFDISLRTLDFCTSLDACLKRAARVESIIKVALHKFHEEQHCLQGVRENSSSEKRCYPKTLEELNNFKAVGDPFSEDFFKVFNSVCSGQIAMLERLKSRKKKLDRKLASMKTYRRISNIIFITAFASVLVCSVVAAALTAPPVLTALAAAAAVPMGSIGTWLASIWSKYEKDLSGQIEIITSMQIGTRIAIKDLDNIRAQIERFQIRIKALSESADFAAEGAEDKVVAGIGEIEKEAESFFETIHELSKHANKCSQQTRMARSLILGKIINGGGSSNGDGGGSSVLAMCSS